MNKEYGDGVAPVSVVIPVYNSAATLERALSSVACQSMLPLEVIIVDDASSDDSVETAKRLAGDLPSLAIRVIALERNRGPASARNRGWEEAAGSYIAFLDADDAWHPDKICLQYRWMRKNPQCVVSGHRCREIKDVDDFAPVSEPLRAERLSPWQFLLANRFSTPSVMLKRELLYRFSEGKHFAEDYLLWLQISLDGLPVYRLRHPLAAVFKSVYGEDGLSGHLWEMEKGELAALLQLRRETRLSLMMWGVFSLISLLKYGKRVAARRLR